MKIVIGRTFDKDVIDEKNNVLLTLIDEYYINPESENVLNIMKNLSKKYNEENDKIVFAYTDAQKNEPRDVVISGQIPPIVLLYTNAMPEKKKIELKYENFTLITEEEVENFLIENLLWTKKEESKEHQEKKEEKKEHIKEEIKDEKKTENKEKKNEKVNGNIDNKEEKDTKEKIQTDL